MHVGVCRLQFAKRDRQEIDTNSAFMGWDAQNPKMQMCLWYVHCLPAFLPPLYSLQDVLPEWNCQFCNCCLLADPTRPGLRVHVPLHKQQQENPPIPSVKVFSVARHYNPELVERRFKASWIVVPPVAHKSPGTPTSSSRQTRQRAL